MATKQKATEKKVMELLFVDSRRNDVLDSISSEINSVSEQMNARFDRLEQLLADENNGQFYDAYDGGAGDVYPQ